MITENAKAAATKGRSKSSKLDRPGPRLLDAVARLAMVCNQDPHEWVCAFGLPKERANQIVERAKERHTGRMPRKADRPMSLIEQVEDHLANGKPPSDQPVIRVGLLHWEPFTTLPLRHLDVSAIVPGSPSIPPHELSMAAAWVRKTAGTVLPEIRRFEFHKVDEIDELIRGLGVRGGKRRWDIAVGLFDLPQRRRMGLWFTDVPGFRVRLGALFFCNTEGQLAPKWDHIAAPDRSDSKRVFHVVTVLEEAAWVFLRGPVQYPEHAIHAVRSLKVDELVIECARVARSLELDSPPESPIGFLLVTDEETCQRVQRTFSAFREHPLNGVATAQRQSTPEIASSEQESQTDVDDQTTLRKFSNWLVKPVEDPEDTRPGYNVTLCLAPSEERLYRQMRRAKIYELFESALEDTATLYAEFCAQGAQHAGALCLFVNNGHVDWKPNSRLPRGIWSAREFRHMGRDRGVGYLEHPRIAQAFCRRLFMKLREVVERDAQFNLWASESADTSPTHLITRSDRDETVARLAHQMTHWLLPPHEEWHKELQRLTNRPCPEACEYFRQPNGGEGSQIRPSDRPR
ncbi:MAG: hypothetical protein JSR77_13415 [Planctomycetes bacterium]|nr:hypothetical protein [Planctomycetota bacterium]